MANCEAKARTNWFRVADEARWNELSKNLVADEDDIEFYDKIDVEGNLRHAFCAYSSIGYRLTPYDSTDEDEDPEFGFGTFLAEMQKILPDGEAFVYKEIGNEKLRFMHGFADVVTNKRIRMISLDDAILKYVKPQNVKSVLW